MRPNLTKATAAAAKPEARRYELRDDRVTGLRLIVHPSGVKTWSLRYTGRGGRDRRLTIGTYSDEEGGLGLDKARAEAAAAKLQTHQGHDPAAARAEARRLAAAGIDKAALFETVWGEYVADEKPRVGTWRESTAKAANHVFETRLRPKWGKRRLEEITKTDVRLLLKGIHLRHPSAARRTRAVVAAFFNWAVADDRIAASPCATLKKQARNRRRTRKLSDDEIRWLWTACEKEQHPFGYMVQLLILTICRRDEISRLRSREVRLGSIRKIILPPDRVKNHTEHEVFITDSMLAVFNAIPRVKSKDGWYFTTNGDNPSSGFSRAKRRLDSAMLTLARAEARERGEDPNAVYIDPWRFHDLRRTGASRMRGLGIDTDVIEACLNHITDSGGLRGLYQQHDFGPEKEAAFNKWSLEVARIVTTQSFVEMGQKVA